VYLTKRAEDSIILGQDGFPMGQALELDNARVNRSGERLVRAFYFTEMATAIPANAWSESDVTWNSDRQTQRQSP